MTSRVFSIAVCLFVILGSWSVAASQGGSVLQGKVITPSGMQPNSPVRVKLTFNGRAVLETFTDLSGRFTFPGIKNGTYQLTAEGDGVNFETTTVYADVPAFGGGGQTFTQDIQLRPVMRKATSATGVVNAFTQEVPPAAKEALETGMKLAEEGKTEAAVENMRKALQIFPKYFEAHLQLGNAFVKIGQANEAIAELDLAREINPKDERLYQTFGLLMMKQKNFPVAVAVFEEAARLNPENPTNPVMRATALIHQAANTSESAPATENRSYLIGRAEVAISQAASLSENKVRPDSMTMALFYELKGEPEKAATELESYVRKTPQLKDSVPLQNEIKRLHDKAKASKPAP